MRVEVSLLVVVVVARVLMVEDILVGMVMMAELVTRVQPIEHSSSLKRVRHIGCVVFQRHSHRVNLLVRMDSLRKVFTMTCPWLWSTAPAVRRR